MEASVMMKQRNMKQSGRIEAKGAKCVGNAQNSLSDVLIFNNRYFRLTGFRSVNSQKMFPILTYIRAGSGGQVRMSGLH
jgi:hypothetical protein